MQTAGSQRGCTWVPYVVGNGPDMIESGLLGTVANAIASEHPMRYRHAMPPLILKVHMRVAVTNTRSCHLYLYPLSSDQLLLSSHDATGIAGRAHVCVIGSSVSPAPACLQEKNARWWQRHGGHGGMGELGRLAVPD